MFARTERLALCDALDAVRPDAPTLCAGWTAHDLAAHVWLRENDPLAASALVIKALADQTQTRMTQVTRERSYADLVAAIRRGPAGLSVFRLPGVDEAANVVEFFVHCEDVRRGNGPAEARDLGTAFEDWVWKRLGLLGRALFRRSPVGVALERQSGSASGPTLRVSPGADIVTLIGPPSELLLFAYGRRDAAEVRVLGQSSTIAALQAADLSV